MIPCHRVITANGDLGGYGGGAPRKRWLLDHERNVASGAAGTVHAPLSASSARELRGTGPTGDLGEMPSRQR